MQTTADFADMQIAFNEDDTAAETLRAANYLLEQVDMMAHHGGLENEEVHQAEEVLYHLKELVDTLESRRRRERFEDAPIEQVAEKLDVVHDLSLDIVRVLDDHNDTIRRLGWPEPNPYKVAKRNRESADITAEDLRTMLADDD